MLSIVAFAAAAALLVVLVRLSHIDPRSFGATLAGLRWLPALVLVVAMGLMASCSAEKWRLIRQQGNNADTDTLPLRAYFGFTALGMAVGQVFPQQVATAITRGAGLRLLGRGTMLQGAGATLFEQLFDLLVAVFCAVATAMLLILRTGPEVWFIATIICVVAGTGLAHLSARFAFPLLQRLGQRHGLAAGSPSSRVGRLLSLTMDLMNRLQVLSPSLVWRLSMLSVLRYIALIAGAYAVTLAGNLPISLFQVAAVMPIVVLAVLLSFAPGGLGVNEWTYASALVAVGVPFPVAVSFALLNRLMNIGGAALVGLLGCAALLRR